MTSDKLKSLPTKEAFEIRSRGGRNAHASGRAYKFTSEKAREAGRKGGIAKHRKLYPELYEDEQISPQISPQIE